MGEELAELHLKVPEIGIMEGNKENNKTLKYSP